MIDIDRFVDDYSDLIYKICYTYGKNEHDSKDIMQNVFLKLMKANIIFENQEHEKAWLIRVTMNTCKDFFRMVFRHKETNEFNENTAYVEKEDLSYVREAIQCLTNKYKDVIYLYYYEGYHVPEIAMILQKNENTIYTWLNRAKKNLKDILGEDAS